MQMMAVWELPPSAGFKIRVNLLTRYGMWHPAGEVGRLVSMSQAHVMHVRVQSVASKLCLAGRFSFDVLCA